MRIQPSFSIPPVALTLTGAAAFALASPLHDPHVGGIGFDGPTTGDLMAVYWNPAALGLLDGAQLMLAGSGAFTTTTVRRRAIDPMTGAPGGPRTFPSTTGRGTTQPLALPPGPGGFAAIGTSVGRRFSVAVAAYTPFAQRLEYRPAANGEMPTRYQLVDADLRNVALVPALAFRVGNELRIGVAPGFLFATGRLVFDEDSVLAGGSGAQGLGADCGGSPCGAENPAAAARYHVASGLGPFDSSLSFTLAGGLFYRRGPISIGIAYSSRPLGGTSKGVEIDADRTTVGRPPRSGGGALCSLELPENCVIAHVTYDLPDIVTGGVTWQANERWSLTGIARWMTFSRHDRIVVRLVGPAPSALAAAGVSEQVVLHRGFRDLFEGRVRLARSLGWLRLGALLRASTAAVPASRLSAAAVDGTTLEPGVAAEGRAGSWLRLTLGYGFAFMPGARSGGTAFDPRAATGCADASGDLAQPSCRARLEGTARPTAAGEYSFTRHTATLSAVLRF